MESFPPTAAFEEAVGRARKLLARHGLLCPTRPEELEAWLQTDTPYPNPSPDELLRNPFLVIHELIEIAAVKRMGLHITKDVIVRNLERINDAHLEAARTEVDIAVRERALGHLESRLEDLRAWCEDPLLTPGQKAAYEGFRRKVETILASMRTGNGQV